jgi:hypothetical protein
MTTDWKALCAELADVLAEEYGVQREFKDGDPLLGADAIELLSRTRTALSQPEPEGPTDEELEEFALKHGGGYFNCDCQAEADILTPYHHHTGGRLMTNQHPITPPPELKRQWIENNPETAAYACEIWLIDRAAQWGYDQRGEVNEVKLQQARDEELEACRMEIIDGAGLLFIDETSDRVELADDLRNARRPKPPSLKEQALEALKHAEEGWRPVPDDCALIRRALEALDD